MRVGEVRHPERGAQGKPLAGISVLAAEQMQALPYATQLLAHLGADVVKVEPPGRGETGRASNPFLVDEDGRKVGATYLRNNLAKRSIALDLKTDAGRALFRRLVPHFDIVAENFRAGSMERMGLGYTALAAENPRLIYLSLSGFGNLERSPYRDWPAYAPIGEAMGGIYEPTRKAGEPPRVVVAGALGDNATALYAVIGALAALQHRERTGLGQHVDIAMYDSMIAMADMVPQLWSMDAPASMAGPGSTALVAAFKASDGYFVIAVLREHMFEKLCRLLGREEWLSDPRFATRVGWAKHTETVIRPVLEAWAATKTKLEAARALAELGITAGPSNVAADIAADPHVELRGMLIEVPRPDSPKPYLVSGNPVKMSRLAEGPLGPAPRLGAHTEDVLRSLLGMDDAEIARLRGEGAIP
ncbi:MAG: CoA transferase [Deltaproteobacteria bacterium]|nr:CoA transferase [Deltaproteobacteria bacterium]